ncbi:MAG: glycosyltransferase family 39 protein [Candidatus Delongbacteria bacterium]|nr:glycosyltransferase family 39 protein [Candidatus Delongbacteria bacterium]
MKNKTHLILNIILVCTIIVIILFSLTPIIDRDALRFHMSFSKEWAENSFLFFRPYLAHYDLSVLNLNYLYMLSFKIFGIEEIPKFIHASFLLFTGLILYQFLKRKYNKTLSLIGFLFTITIPICIRLASEVYVDLGLYFFSTLATINLILWIESDFKSNKFFILSALGSGLALGTKYNALIFVFVICLIVAFIVSRRFNDSLKAIKLTSLYLIIVIILVSPWLIRNYINSGGNPLYPLFKNVFHTELVFEEPIFGDPEKIGEVAWRKQSGETILDLFAIPFRIFFTGEDHNFLQFDGVLNPFLLLLIPFAGFKNNKPNKVLLTIFLLVFFVTLYVNNIRIRYFIPMIPTLILLNISALDRLWKKNRIYKTVVTFSILIMLIINFKYIYSSAKVLEVYEYFTTSYTKEDYLDKNVELFKIYQFINNNLEKDAVIYEVLCGGRDYYVDRVIIHDNLTLDRYFLNRTELGGEKEFYYNFLNEIPNSYTFSDSDKKSLKASHILIKPKSFYNTFLDIFNKFDAEKNNEQLIKANKFVEFINEQTPLFQQKGAILYKINWDKCDREKQ